ATVILHTSDRGFGILISSSAPTAWIPMNNPATLGCVNGSVIESHFLASLKWRTYAALTRIGAFNASANVDVTFK
ncbi:fimbrial protein, partial [Klebsiella sp. K794]